MILKKLLSLLFLIVCQAALAEESASIQRKETREQYQSVGLITYRSVAVCSSMILQHGLIVTAKHCFQHQLLEPNNVEIESLKIGFPANGEIEITGSAVVTFSKEILQAKAKKVIFDSGDNDIAYILYDAKDTAGKIQLEDFIVSDASDKPAQRQLEIIGFPMSFSVYDGGPMKRTTSFNCKETDKTGILPPMENDPGYNGLLIDTSCPAFAGNSGGPVFALPSKSNSKKMLLGILTHTFHVMPDGSLNQNYLLTDSFGYYMESNYSPFSSAKDIKLLEANSR